jgi:hypothetical protein
MAKKTKKANRLSATRSGEDRVYFFRMNGCGHCESVKEIWPQVVSIITQSRPMVRMIEVESQEKDRLLDDYAKSKLHPDAINAYPDLRILTRNGKTSTFDSERTVPALVSWIETNVTPIDNPRPRKKSKKAELRRGGMKRKTCNRRGRRSAARGTCIRRRRY